MGNRGEQNCLPQMSDSITTRSVFIHGSAAKKKPPRLLGGLSSMFEPIKAKLRNEAIGIDARRLRQALKQKAHSTTTSIAITT